jgi:crossover junction endodeoxyribonuclease RuvC
MATKRNRIRRATLRGSWHFPGVGIRPEDFENMRRRLSGAATRTAAAPRTSAHGAANAAGQIILGIDPSLRGTGFGLIRLSKPQAELLAHGTIRCPASWERSRCLAKIAQTLREEIKRARPVICVVEGLFYAQNLQTALIMGEARGASLATAAEAGLEVYELAARKVKQAIVGYGGAQKLAVAKMVQRLLQVTEPLEPDAADALALALAFAHETGRYNLAPPKRI